MKNIIYVTYPCNRIGDHLPDKAIVHLPSTLTMKSVYDRMKEDFRSQRETVSQPQFYNLWKEYARVISIAVAYLAPRSVLSAKLTKY